ncbi:hypothetical protein [Pararhodospirillum photometricum]|nr:hypothetical protein [Pararhodospirillum photometricum]
MVSPPGLPSLREDVRLLEGPSDPAGAPTWTLHDPGRNRFYRLSWPAFEILARWSLGDPRAVVAAVRAQTPLTPDEDEVWALAAFLTEAHLVHAGGPDDVARLLGQEDRARTGWGTWLLHHYLFFRVPLLRPGRLLDVLLPWVSWMGGRGFAGPRWQPCCSGCSW